MSKATVKLGGVALAGNSGIQWQFISGVQPYRTVVQCHKSDWGTLRGRIGSALTLEITDSRGQTTRVKEVYILHEVASDSAARKAFVIADRRWKWPYKLVARDYNITRKTGNKTAFGSVPIELDQVVDVYDYLNYSLKQDGNRYKAKEIIEDVLKVIDEESFTIQDFPIKENGEGELPIQNVTLRDSGDVAVARALSYIPGADVYVNADGRIIVYDGTDLQAAGQYVESLPDWTRSGDYPVEVDRSKIRPEKVVVHYQREVEVLFEFKDDYFTPVPPNPDLPYLENVIPCVDRQTTVVEFDPFLRKDIEKKNLPPGTWVNIQGWLAAMDKEKPPNSAPWTFDTIKVLWTIGDLEGALGAGGKDIDEDADISTRVSALRQHFRQTFRISPVYMQRIRSLRAVRVALYDPVSGARAPAAVWGQACIIPNTKGKRMAKRGDVPPEESVIYRNVDYLAPDAADPKINIVATTPAPAQVTILDEELGVFRVEWIAPPAGTVESFVPCMLVNLQNQAAGPTRDMGQQDDKPIGLSVRVESGATGLVLDATTQMKVLMTVVPAAPNNEKQFQRKEVEPSLVKSRYRGDYGIDGGSGPELQVFVPPGEMTARFAWQNDEVALTTTQQLFGLGAAANGGGLEGPDLPGYVFTNDGEGTQAGAGRHIYAHSMAMAAEALAAYADSWQGTVASPIPGSGLKLVGNMSGAAIRVGQAPSAKVDAVLSFPGQQRQISRFALLPDSTRSQVLGTLPFRS